jgi:PAS domain S-box-containing protein
MTDERPSPDAAFLDSIVENIPHMIFVKDAAELRFVRFNKAGEELLGISVEKMIGKNDYDFFPPEQAAFFVQKDREVLNGKRLVVIEEEPIQTARGLRLLRTKKIPIFDADGAPRYLLGISEDVTEQRELVERIRRGEARQRALAEASAPLAEGDELSAVGRAARAALPVAGDGCIVVVAAPKGPRELFVHVDAAREREWTRRIDGKAAELVPVALDGPVVVDVEAPDHPPFSAATIAALRGGGARRLLVAPLVARGQVLGALTFVVDGSKRGFDEEDVAFAARLARRVAVDLDNAALYTRLQGALDARDEFFSIASHELRTPLTTARLMVEALARAGPRPADEEKARRRVDGVEAQLERLGRLVDGLLDVSRIATGRLKIDPIELDLGALCKELVERFEPEAARRGCALSLVVDCTRAIVADRLRVEQVLTNLLSNAVKYAPGAPVEIEARTSDAGARILVRDHGPGVASSDLDRIFERFERAATNAQSGLGLGLYVARQICEAHGGSIRCERADGGGMRFVVELPAER